MSPLVETALDHSQGEADALFQFYDAGGMIPSEEFRNELLMRIADCYEAITDGSDPSKWDAERDRVHLLNEYVQGADIGEAIDR